MGASNENYWVRQINTKRKPWLVRNIWWFVLGMALVFVVMLVTNPKDTFKHNQAVIKCAEQKLYPAMVTALRHEKMRDVQSKTDDEKAWAQFAWSLAEGLLGSGVGGDFASSMIADELAINEVKNFHIYSVGCHDGETVTIGAFGHVWTIYSFMSEERIASEMMKKLN